MRKIDSLPNLDVVTIIEKIKASKRNTIKFRTSTFLIFSEIYYERSNSKLKIKIIKSSKPPREADVMDKNRWKNNHQPLK